MLAKDNERIGELVQMLSYYGELTLYSGLDLDTQEFWYRAQWRDEWQTVSRWATDLTKVLERVAEDVLAIVERGV